jgi:TRAP transporter TatT component family protein
MLLSGCSVKRFAINKVGDSLANSGTTCASDDDPDLVGQAVPFGLKLMEGRLAESPKHRGLLFAASPGMPTLTCKNSGVKPLLQERNKKGGPIRRPALCWIEILG